LLVFLAEKAGSRHGPPSADTEIKQPNTVAPSTHIQFTRIIHEHSFFDHAKNIDCDENVHAEPLCQPLT
jgi:hypothetical protein